MRAVIRTFWNDRRGGATIEYVVLFLPMILIVFATFQVSFAYHYTLTAQKAAENGARVAAVRDPVRLDLPKRNVAAQGATSGTPCASGGCATPSPAVWSCGFADLTQPQCDADAFEDIYQEVSAIAYLMQREQLIVSYEYKELGFANGDFTPMVKVTIAETPFDFAFGINLNYLNDPEGESQEVQKIPSLSAIAIAEDLSSTN